MPENEPVTKLDARYSDEKATADEWADAVERLKAAEVYWLSTVRPQGRPHVTPLIAVWHDGGLHFCTGADERKAKNLRDNREVVLTTGANALDEGYDVVVEGSAERVSDETRLRALAEAYVEKYGSDWTFEVRDGVFVHQGGTALVFRVEPRTAFGFAKSPYSQTRWQFTE
ncbi:nitroimidazol reductase NimA-like FMN-containing flavoprotein (pyridoxamine 5'-phosphate oxidase superfamily) [Streptomyces sp. SLBN-118]|uniref:pyridoxamine 5'-phosphate oxidase family protein n=1 Tax=Streptomyces sp. SLBN-118 TaxID=2768454 RepID=UPI001153F766|nr:pyridoxamine 5'-phosphate oxidase family protein [Streptomyces sp. SLBN-118]TQK44071.1 nitroimidazol reductase NimA-like FMN-containing flavoprotein (pyridoxamine 5'-phosphate oxidase superfamily) [Streptomyces sp. SLBN-118]